MKNLNATIYTALTTNAALIALVSVANIFHGQPPDVTRPTFPYISFFELDNREAVRADDAELLSEIVYVVDIFVQNASPGAIALAVNTVMVGLGFVRGASTDLYEDDNVRHKHMKFKILT